MFCPNYPFFIEWIDLENQNVNAKAIGEDIGSFPSIKSNKKVK